MTPCCQFPVRRNWYKNKLYIATLQDYLNLPMLFEGQLNVGVFAVLVGAWLLVGRCWMEVNNYFCTAGEEIMIVYSSFVHHSSSYTQSHIRHYASSFIKRKKKRTHTQNK